MFDQDCRDLWRSLVLAIATGLGGSLVLSLLVLLMTPDAWAGEIESSNEKAGLYLQLADGRVLQDVPHLKTDVKMDVTAMIARVRVKQRYINPSKQWAEGIYVFPLPDDAAVDHMRLVYAERVIEGEIKPKPEARRIYEKAKNEGKKASLLDQQRANVFTTSVANIPPGEEVLVEIEYQQSITPSENRFSLRFPMVVAPRYIPGTALDDPDLNGSSQFSEGGWASNTDQVPDASLITPPVIDESESKINPVSIRVDLNTGLPMSSLTSLYHQIDKKIQSDGHVILRLHDAEIPADRDFVLQWDIQQQVMPEAALFREQHKGAEYGLMMLMPPQLKAVKPVSRELVLVVDTSGSMYGESMQQAKSALKVALRDLKPGDFFNLIQFDDQTRALHSQAVELTPGYLQSALEYVDSLEADGGTEMLPAMQLALASDSEKPLLRQVVFLTDGAVGNESALFQTIQKDLGNSRLFTVGIGAAPNSYFMTRAAEYGRGSFTYIGDVNEVGKQMAQLLKRLSTPAMTDISIDWQGANVSQSPQRIPDLYAGEPLVMTFSSEGKIQKAMVSGMIDGQPWQHEVDLTAGGQQRNGLHVLWARRMIRDWMAKRVQGEDEQKIKNAIIRIAMQHHLVSKYTSLVAVDKTPSRPLDQALAKKHMPTNMPKGMNQQKVFGHMPQTATPAQLYAILGLMLLLSAVWMRRRGDV